MNKFVLLTAVLHLILSFCDLSSSWGVSASGKNRWGLCYWYCKRGCLRAAPQIYPRDKVQTQVGRASGFSPWTKQPGNRGLGKSPNPVRQEHVFLADPCYSNMRAQVLMLTKNQPPSYKITVFSMQQSLFQVLFLLLCKGNGHPATPRWRFFDFLARWLYLKISWLVLQGPLEQDLSGLWGVAAFHAAVGQQ